MDSSNDQTEEFDAVHRSLCPDGNCTGLIGDDGRCKICGLREDGLLESSSSAEMNSEPSDSFEQDRELCSDGNCTGLLGPDGRCKVCGKSS